MSTDLQSVDVRLCARGELPGELIPSQKSSIKQLLKAELGMPGESRRTARIQSGRIQIDGARAGDCLFYTVALPVDANGWRPAAMRRDRNLLLSSGLLLWKPRAFKKDARVSFQIAGPDDLRISTPWARSASGWTTGVDVFQFLSQVAFTSEFPFEFEAWGANVVVAKMGGDLAVGQDEIEVWLESTVRTVSLVSGEFPADQLLVVLVPVAAEASPVLFGSVVRGGGPSITLYISSGASADELQSDWVPIHEMSHLLHPYSKDPWLAEGVATYYQEVLLARAGVQSELDAWRALERGFRRGRRGGSGRTLQEESADMRKTAEFHRVYWAGTALMLMLDVELRRAEGDIVSLDSLLLATERCCDGARPWSASELVERWDRLTGKETASEVCAPWLRTDEFPKLAEVYSFLGIRRDRHGDIRLVDNARGANIRRAIMGQPAR